MYMPGRLRTASSPSRTWIAEASYLPSSTACPSLRGARPTAASATASAEGAPSALLSGLVSGSVSVLLVAGVLAGICSATSHPLHVCAHITKVDPGRGNDRGPGERVR